MVAAQTVGIYVAFPPTSTRAEENDLIDAASVLGDLASDTH